MNWRSNLPLSRPRWAAAALVCASACGTAAADVELYHHGFENSDAAGWYMSEGTVNFSPGGVTGDFFHLPVRDWYWVMLENAGPDIALTGDLTRHGGELRVEVDVQTMTLRNWFGDDMDPAWFPLVIQFVDLGNPADPSDDVSVYYEGLTMPPLGEGWHTLVYTIPDPSQEELPAGWGGTGDEDPQTFEPRLPADRTYRSVMANVDVIRFTTARPGYLYIPSFWEAGFDDVRLLAVDGEGCPGDWDQDESVTSGDISAFLADWFADLANGTLETDVDDSGTVTSADISVFLGAWFEGVGGGC